MYGEIISDPSAASVASLIILKGNDFMNKQKNFDPKIFEVDGVHGYVDENGNVHLLIDDVARGLGIVQVKKNRVPKSGDIVPKSGDKSYTAIRWERVNKYLRDCDCLGENDPDVKSGDYIPEQWFYLLAMKANNERAKTFQNKVAYEIMPSIRKHGYYSLNGETAPAVAEPAPAVEEPTDIYRVYAHLLSDGNVKIGCTKRFIPRAGEVERETGLQIIETYFTPKMSYENAHLIEWCTKKKLAPNHVKGEIFAVELYKAYATIVHYTKMAFATLPTKSINLIADKQD